MQGDGEINALFSGIKGAQTPPGGGGGSMLHQDKSCFENSIYPDKLIMVDTLSTLYALCIHINAYNWESARCLKIVKEGCTDYPV